MRREPLIVKVPTAVQFAFLSSLTQRQRAALREAWRFYQDQDQALMVGSREHRRDTLREMVKLGLLTEYPNLVPMMDNDGNEKNYRVAYELTERGRVLGEILERST